MSSSSIKYTLPDALPEFIADGRKRAWQGMASPADAQALARRFVEIYRLLYWPSVRTKTDKIRNDNIAFDNDIGNPQNSDDVMLRRILRSAIVSYVSLVTLARRMRQLQDQNPFAALHRQGLIAIFRQQGTIVTLRAMAASLLAFPERRFFRRFTEGTLDPRLVARIEEALAPGERANRKDRKDIMAALKDVAAPAACRPTYAPKSINTADARLAPQD